MSTESEYKENSTSVMGLVQKSQEKEALIPSSSKDFFLQPKAKERSSRPKKKIQISDKMDHFYIKNLQNYVKEIIEENQKNKELLVEYEATIAALKDEQEDLQEALIEVTQLHQAELEKQKQVVQCPQCKHTFDSGLWFIN